MKQFIGVDVSKKTFDCTWIDDDGVYHHRQFSMNKIGMDKAVKWVSNPQSHWVMEATGSYHQRLACTLFEQDFLVSVVNPLVIKRFGQMKLNRAKTDKADALLITEYAIRESTDLVSWKPASEEINLLNSLDKWLDTLIRQRTKFKNKLEAITHSAYQSQHVLSQLNEQLETLDKQIKSTENALLSAVKTTHQKQYDQLTSIPSIGNKTAAKLIAITHGFTQFNTDKQLLAYIGLCPRTYTSGTSVKGRGSITKMGMNRVRQLLYLCAVSAKRHNPACVKFAERLAAKGKPTKVILIAIAAKLVRQAFAVIKSQKNFSIERSFV